MIDFEKLKTKIHECLQGLNKSCEHPMFRNNEDVRMSYKNQAHALEWVINQIKILEESDDFHRGAHNAIKSTYKIGQEVWYLDDANEISSEKIAEIDANSNEKYLLEDENWWHYEDTLFISKSALIQAQINHWQSLAINEICSTNSEDKCNHIPNLNMSNPDEYTQRTFECKRCGEFYK
jgi:hypothetical protein